MTKNLPYAPQQLERALPIQPLANRGVYPFSIESEVYIEVSIIEA